MKLSPSGNPKPGFGVKGSWIILLWTPARSMILSSAPAPKKVCENKFIEYGYDIKHAAYVQAVETIFPPLAGRVTMKYIFVENDPPNAIRVMPVGGTMKTSGQWRWGKACEVWADCLARYGPKTPWPAYPDDNEPAE